MEHVYSFITSGPDLGQHYLNDCLIEAVHSGSKCILFAKTLLTKCILVDSSTVICWMSPFVILGVTSLFCHFYSIFDGKSS